MNPEPLLDSLTRLTLLFGAAVLLPDTQRGILGGPWGVFLDAPQAGRCLHLALHGFADGSVRSAGQVMDETCQHSPGDWQTLTVNGSLAQFNAMTARGPLQAQDRAWQAAREATATR